MVTEIIDRRRGNGPLEISSGYAMLSTRWINPCDCIVSWNQLAVRRYDHSSCLIVSISSRERAGSSASLTNRSNASRYW